jgi:hypothetical protein
MHSAMSDMDVLGVVAPTVDPGLLCNIFSERMSKFRQRRDGELEVV